LHMQAFLINIKFCFITYLSFHRHHLIKNLLA
jgi:hypothetical protein